jgi:DNA anti-recombination protein RmuC
MKATDEGRAGQDTGSVTADPMAGGASIDKVREILFGVQMRDYDKRFARLEERILKDTSELKDDVRKRVDALEQFVRQEFETLGQRLSSERAGREDAVKGLGEQHRDATQAFEKKTAAIDDQLARAQRELRQQMLDLQKELSDEILQRHQEMLSTLTRDSSELRDEKADRAALASLFTEMAMRLSNQFRLPTTEGV